LIKLPKKQNDPYIPYPNCFIKNYCISMSDLIAAEVQVFDCLALADGLCDLAHADVGRLQSGEAAERGDAGREAVESVVAAIV
jgi:hypothetical protein